MEIAARQGKSLTEAKRTNSSTEFLLWREFFSRQLERKTADHYYLAQVALEVRRSWVKNPASLRLSEFLLHAASPEEQKAREISPEERARRSEEYWKFMIAASWERTQAESASSRKGKPPGRQKKKKE